MYPKTVIPLAAFIIVIIATLGQKKVKKIAELGLGCILIFLIGLAFKYPDIIIPIFISVLVIILLSSILLFSGKVILEQFTEKKRNHSQYIPQD